MNMPTNAVINEPTKVKVAIGRWDMPAYSGVNPIGADCQVSFWGDVSQKYISFGQFVEATKSDEYGVPEDSILHHCFEGEDALKELMQKNELDFIVLSYKLVYPKDEVAIPHNAFDYELETTDHLKASGQLYVDMGHTQNLDDVMSTTFEVNMIPGTDTATQCMHLLFDNDNTAMSVFKKGDSYIIRPESGVEIRSIVLEDGTFGYEVR